MTPVARDGHDAGDLVGHLVGAQWMRERADTVDRHLAGPAAREDLRLRRVHRAVQPVGRALRRDRPKRLVLGLADRHPAGLGLDAVHRRAHDDLEQRISIEVRGERLAGPPHRLLQPHALLAQL